MKRYIIKRLLQMIPTLLGVTILCFLIIQAIPGDPAKIIAGIEATPEQVEQIRNEMGLDKSISKQYFDFVWGAVQGDLGVSLRSNNSVSEELFSRLPVTLLLTTLSVVIASIIGIFAGVSSAIKPNSFRDNFLMTFSLFGISMPVFWIGILLIYVFSLTLGIFPAGGSSNFIDFILPSIALGIASSAILSRLTRSSVLEVVSEDFIRTARGKGLKERKVVYKHILKNALIPVITIIGMEFGTLLGGSVLIETVFSMNGIGRYIVQAILFRDYPAIQGGILLIAMAFVIINFIVDILYSLLDPRIQYK